MNYVTQPAFYNAMDYKQIVEMTVKPIDYSIFKEDSDELSVEETLFKSFLKVVQGGCDDSDTVQLGVRYHWHTSTKYSSDYFLWKMVSQELIDLTTVQGLREAYARLAYILAAVKLQSNGEEGVLTTDTTGNFFGWFRMPDKQWVSVLVRWSEDHKKWCFVGWYNHVRFPGYQYLSRYSSQ